MTEQNVKEAFEEAEAEEAVLVIDEADSMLSSRDRAHRSWESSFTNEFLAQMERIKGSQSQGSGASPSARGQDQEGSQGGQTNRVLNHSIPKNERPNRAIFGKEVLWPCQIQ
ncbi:MAG: ATP-binding protein [Deltaproteobacteria bacterium]|nr:ATP-binding protein [Deltaproteobacteria bacterium]